MPLSQCTANHAHHIKLQYQVMREAAYPIKMTAIRVSAPFGYIVYIIRPLSSNISRSLHTVHQTSINCR